MMIIAFQEEQVAAYADCPRKKYTFELPSLYLIIRTPNALGGLTISQRHEIRRLAFDQTIFYFDNEESFQIVPTKQ
eukprot:845770-Prorocentrum_minimum.AAC.3